ncbi:ABC transporter permease [Hoylesella enoeca]|uniref:Transport permease protein n=1 Tax=Hoylesella enoeca TaxID=76123 RepID=A0A0S2KKD0_9BACT|nr:ABC transporter permease [Hoylesella enoeca]ALO48760.1 ABC transporter permease [Hoylesella enoeca]
MILKYLIEKEFIQMRHNPFLPRLIVLFPVIIMCVVPWVTTLEVKNITIGIVDNDHSTLSEQLTKRVAASPYFKFKGMQGTYDEALHEIEKSNIDLVTVIPPHYERDLVNGRQPQVFIAANAVNGTKGGIGSGYLSSIVYQQRASAMHTEPHSPVSTLSLFNPHKDYKVFMIPALLALLAIMLCGFIPALNIVGEKEQGTIEQINVTPVRKSTFILAKLIPYWLIALFVATVCLLLSWGIYGITPHGNVGLIYVLIILLAFIFSGLGLIVSNYSDAMQQAMLVMWFILVCLMLLSGLFTPIASMPDWAQHLTLVNPLRYFVDAMRTVFVRGGEAESIALQLVVLTAFAVLIDIWAVLSYKKNS